MLNAFVGDISGAAASAAAQSVTIQHQANPTLPPVQSSRIRSALTQSSARHGHGQKRREMALELYCSGALAAVRSTTAATEHTEKQIAPGPAIFTRAAPSDSPCTISNNDKVAFP